MKNHDVCRGGLGHLYVAAAEWQHRPLRHGAMAGPGEVQKGKMGFKKHGQWEKSW